jgi:hypothetical protein
VLTKIAMKLNKRLVEYFFLKSNRSEKLAITLPVEVQRTLVPQRAKK